MKKLFLVAIMSLAISHVCADNYKILYVNDPSLTYKDGRKVQKGDVISDASSIKWEKERQAVKVINQSTKRQTLFTSREWVRAKGTGALVYIQQASTQASGNSSYAKLYNSFKSQYELLDSIRIPTDMEQSDNCYFTVAYMYGDTKITKRLGQEDGAAIIDMTLFDVDDKKLEPRDVVLSVEYVNKKEYKTIFVKDKVQLYIIPEKIEE